MKKNRFYAWGQNSYGNYSSNSTNSGTPTLYSLSTQQEIVDVCGNYQRTAFLLSDRTIVELGESSKFETQRNPKNELISKMSCGGSHFAILCQSGSIYIWGSDEYHNCSMGFTFENDWIIQEPKKLDFFEDKNIIDVACAIEHTFFLSGNGDLWVCGEKGIEKMEDYILDETNKNFRLVDKNVVKFWTGVFAWHAFIQRSDGIVYSCGKNSQGECSIGDKSEAKRPKKVKDVDFNNIKKFSCAENYSLLLDNSGDIYSSGNNGNFLVSTSFKKIEHFNDMRIIEITSGFAHSMALDENNEIYIWGNNRDNQVGKNLNGDKIHKLVLPNLEKKSTIWPICGSWNSFVIFNCKAKFDNEFLTLFENQIFFDFTLNGIKAHKILVESRTGKNIDEIIKLIENQYTKEETNIFLRWVYGDPTKNNSEILQNILKSLNASQNINIPFSKTLEQLFADENSKNFILKVRIDDEDDDDEESFEEIPVHKFILQAKSGLFRDLFKNVTEKSNSVTDYSGKTIESIEILIKFFYLNKIVLTADDDPQLLCEELEDAIDYYQLSENSKFQREYVKIKNLLN
ncbi:hypothetical protein M0812_08646 [Anaeramoeba flamelloides]|uniref:BTB domain-containing protein n=1 Tax=Anaeramoeba flamelloides TaxID=1746091 RepID=A0AAV8A1X2_9EUKA|nr:hypothetical protein M0812_08646 [Anaeramoeba flamelloides]